MQPVSETMNFFPVRVPLLRSIFLIALSLLFIGCNANLADPSTFPTATTVRVIQMTPVPTVDRNLQPVASQHPAATAESVVMDCQATAGQPMVRHEVEAGVDYGAHQVEVDHRVRYLNRSNESLPEIVFDVESNRIAGAFVMHSITYRDGMAVPAYVLTGRRLEVELSEPLEPGCAVELRLQFTLNVPAVGEGISAYAGYFGYTPRQLNLGHWLPTLATRHGGSWITHETVSIGEQLVSDTANWHVMVQVSNAPEGLIVTAPGTVTREADNRWLFELADAREFAATMSDQYRVTEQQASNGVTVEMYSFSDAVVSTGNGPVDGAAFALESATTSLAMYSDLFGEYPYDRLVVVQGDFPDGMEFSGLVFVGGDWFRSFVGDPASYLLLITVHEVAHQWWYARVGSDQATTPWLDEALATYSEYIYLEEFYPELKDWWWQFRVGTFVQADYNGARVDSSVYQFSTARDYINAVYLRGSQMLHALRDDLGTEAFFGWLRRYAQAGGGRIMTPELFWSLLSPSDLALTQATRTAYLGMPNVQIVQPETTEAAEVSQAAN